MKTSLMRIGGGVAVLAAAGVLFAFTDSGWWAQPGDALRPTQPDPAAEDPAYVLGFTMKTIDGNDQRLSDYAGKVVLIVNVASKCGLTPQYEALQKLYDQKKDAGLVILGFPANDFNGQEPGTDEEIRSFCTGTYHVTFPMFSKISVKGEDRSALYKRLTGLPDPLGGEIKWNFTKFLVDRTGKAAARFEPKTKPDDAEVIKKIDELLASKP